MDTLTFNASNWSDGEVIAATEYIGCDQHHIVFKGMEFYSLEYCTGAFSGIDEYRCAELKHGSSVVATAIQEGNLWYAVEKDGELSREDKNPLVALLQVAANIM